GDFIENKKWWFAFDSDNDDSFEDEDFVLISDGNENVIHQNVNHVGKYLFKLEVKETFGQPTIDKFVTDADRKRDDNRDVEESLRIVEVKNVAPIVELNIEPREAVEVVVFYDSGQETKLEMEAQFERLNMELMERRMRTNIKLVDVSKDKFSIGDTVTNFYNYYRNLYVTFKYEKYTKEYHEDKDQHKNKDISPYIHPLFNVLIEKIVRSEEEYTSLPTIAEGTARVFYERSRTKSKDRTIDIYGYTFDDPEVGSGNGSNVFEVRTLHKTDDYKEIIHGSPDISYDFDNNYRVGLKDHEEISEYKVANIDKFINDELRDEGSNKYAVFITDSKASFHMMTDNTRKLLTDKGYKLRFSMKKSYLESGPKLPQVLDVKIGKNNKTYYLTPYGNIISVGGEVVGGDGDVYYKYEDGLRWQDIEENLTGITRWQDMDELSPITDITCNKGACKRIYIDSDKNLKVEGYDFTFDTEIDSFYYFDTLVVWEKEGVVKASSYDVTKGRFSNPDTLMNTSIKSIRAKRISGYSTYGIVKSSTDNLSNFVCIEGRNNESIVIESGHYTKITYHEDAWETGYNDYWMNNKNLYKKYKVKKSDLKIAVYDNKEDEYRNYRNEKEFWRDTEIRRSGRKYTVWVIEEYNINWNNKDYTENANDTVKVIGTIDETKKYIRQTIALQDGIPIVIRIGEDYIAEGFGNAKYGGLGNFYKSGYSKPDQTKRNKIDTREKHRYYSRKNRIYGDIISKNSREGGLRGNENYKSIPYYSKDWLPSIKTNQTLDTAFSTSIFNYMSAYDMIAYNIQDKVYDEDIKKLVDGIVSDNDGKIDRENAYVLLGTKANMKTFYSDYENDDLYDYRWDLVHDEKFFENDLGKDPKAKLNGDPIEVFDYTGHYKIELKVRDNPVGDDDRFDSYRLWNKDKTTLNVYVHRKPRVRDGLYAKKTDGKLHIYAVDEGSYDLDHLSQSNRGIRSHDWYWRTDRNRIWKNEKLDLRDAEYNTTYYISHRVKDEEGVWSEFSSREIVIGEDIPVVITANIDAYLNSKFDIDKIPVDEKISVKDIKVTYYDEVNLLATLEKNGSVIKELLNKDSNTSGVNKDDTGFIYEDIVEKLPHNLDDGDYSVRLVARDLSD
ncbi:MAG: hypothetical protein N4A76_09790, partial [Firmicutes bacterium]|nr:hypothetical protein [Bacillota bacterium]